MRSTLKLIVPALLVVGWLGSAGAARAEFPELEESLREVAKRVAEKLADKKVFVAARELSKSGARWPVHQAAGVEFTMALRLLKVDAVRAAADTRVDKLDVPKTAFSVKDVKLLKGTGRDVLIGVEWTSAPKLKCKIVAFQADPDKPLWTELAELSVHAASLDKNTPPRNVSVAAYARRQLGNQIGTGESSELLDEALKLVETTRRGFYRWGRELGPKEPWLPGDILQMEKVEYKLDKVLRKINRQTMVIDEIAPQEITVLQQNTFPKGRVVQRDTYAMKGFIDGEIVAFRPWDWPEEVPLTTQRPIRFIAAKPAGKGSATSVVDLLKAIDPKLDEVHGVWFFENKNLRSQREFAGRIQIPVDLPKAYVLKMKVERLEGPEQFGFGIVVDGFQSMVSIDGSDGKVTGLNQLDGKSPADNNETTRTATYFEDGKKCDIECRVEPGQVTLTIDGKSAFEWKGDAARLTVGPDYIVPKKDWLFLSATNTCFEISSLTLEPIDAP